MPRFPLLLDAGETLIHAVSPAQLEKKLSKMTFADEARRDIIDARAEGFSFYPKMMLVSPALGVRRWTKLQVIELYNARKQPDAPALRSTSLGSRSLASIVSEAVELLS